MPTANPGSDSDTYSCAYNSEYNIDADSCSNNTYAFGNRNTQPDTFINCNTYAYSNCNAISYAHTNRNTYADSCSNSNTHTTTNRDTRHICFRHDKND